MWRANWEMQPIPSWHRSSDLRRSRGRQDRLLWHPVVLAAAVQFPAHLRYANFGFPGSGNILCANLLTQIMSRSGVTDPQAVSSLRSLAEHFFVSTIHPIRRCLEGFGLTSFDSTLAEFPTLSIFSDLTDTDGIVSFTARVYSNRHIAQTDYMPAIQQFRPRRGMNSNDWVRGCLPLSVTPARRSCHSPPKLSVLLTE